MSGFLHRLAARAIGSAQTLRSAAYLPYAAQPSSIDLAEPEGQIAVQNDTDHQPRQEDNSGAERDFVSGRQQSPASHFTKTGVQPSSVVMPPAPEVLVTQLAPEFSRGSKRQQAQLSSVKGLLRQSYLNMEKAGTGETPVLTETIGTDLPMSATASVPADNQNAIYPDDIFPLPLLPVKRVVRFPALHAVAPRGESSAFARQGPVEETTEVHVSIGRIEVTAAHEAPAPKRQAPTGVKTMSLDEYLSRRQRET